MHQQVVSRSFVSAMLAALAALVGLAACTGPTSPSAPDYRSMPDQTPDSFERLVGAWSSKVYGSPHIEVAIPEGWLVRLRGRCTGSGELAVHVSGQSFSQDERWPCIERWEFSKSLFPPDERAVGHQDLGPYPVVIDRADTITSWDLEAYSTELPPSASPRPVSS
ncbi:hypothetical protein [Dactylosporangium sp. NPDC048998]|uniref:hypothetical protein n=1 Tax=Dactylosporangium sp. NPDC048998 TaxID=3363976 RepID=UPI00371E9872